MHSHDRTLLSSLGFSDPDKKDRTHDLACQYLAQPGVACGMLRSLFELEGTLKRSEPERLISKGSGQYRTTIGFADLMLMFDVPSDQSGWWFVLVEVKIHRVPVGDIIRQMTLYREHLEWFDCRKIVVATTFDLSVDDVEMLQRKKISHIKLGRKFEEFCDQPLEVAQSIEI